MKKIFLIFVNHLRWLKTKMKFQKIIQILSNPKFFLATIFWLMILVVVGTLAQANIGLYDSQQKYFSSWFLMLWFIPVPGGRLTLLIMFVNLFAFILKPSFWSIKKIGIITIHCGVLLLLIGGGLTAWFSSEGMMSIKEGKVSNSIFNSYDKEFVIMDTSNPDYDNFTVISDDVLEKGSVIESSKIPFSIEIVDYFMNCSVIPRDNPDFINYRGFAQRFLLVRKENEKERELNRSGIIFKISNANELSDGTYSLVLEQSIPQTINVDGKDLTLILRRERTYLPFSLELVDFRKELHPGTDIAKSYSSKINLHEKDIKRSVIIEMNAPLRHRNYTFFQSSFIEDYDSDTTILSVVKNYGRLFPYISSIIMSVGLLLHMILRLPTLFSERKRKRK